ncbi:hypothetical protein WJX72_012329 [[Myrmecia] bisecta]|uniref:Uncharacterized protein n=1 Tax=[Myrmecia] bisecta TaxID=41462 RepID=A0AAW1QGT3_9CHLO
MQNNSSVCFTAAQQRSKNEKSAAKNLIYNINDAVPEEPPRGRSTGHRQPHPEAPFAQYENLPEDTYPAAAAYTARLKHKEVQNKVGDTKTFDADVYAANRAANMENQLLSRTKNFTGSGNILAHN